jgi:hypothetical protein
VEGNLLGPRKTAGQNLTDDDRSGIRLLSGRRKTLDCAKNLGHALRLIRKQKSNLSAHNLARRATGGRPLLTGNRTSPALEDELIQVLSSHKVRDLTSQLGLAIAQGLDLRLERADLVVDANPSAQSLTDLVSHLFVSSSDL